MHSIDAIRRKNAQDSKVEPFDLMLKIQMKPNEQQIL